MLYWVARTTFLPNRCCDGVVMVAMSKINLLHCLQFCARDNTLFWTFWYVSLHNHIYRTIIYVGSRQSLQNSQPFHKGVTSSVKKNNGTRNFSYKKVCVRTNHCFMFCNLTVKRIQYFLGKLSWYQNKIDKIIIEVCACIHLAT